jgi:hypothetical protein
MHPLLRVVVGALALTASITASAVPFTYLAQTRSISINGTLSLIDSMGNPAVTASQSATAATDSGDFGAFDDDVGLGGLVLDHPEGNASGNGRAFQVSSLGAGEIRFDGGADVFVSGFPNGASELSGSGGAASRFATRFVLDAPLSVYLSMDSEIGPTNNDYRFLLERDDGTPIWSDTVFFDDNGNEIRRFTQVLDLDAGTYRVSADLTASSFFFNDGPTRAGRVLAEFSIRPVPEPGSAVVVLFGLLLALSAHATRRQLVKVKQLARRRSSPLPR